MRILIATSTYPPQPNGQAVAVGNLAEGLAARGHSVTVLVPALNGSSSAASNGVRLYSTPFIALGPSETGVVIAHSFNRVAREIFREAQPEIVHCQDWAPINQFLAIAAHRRGLKVVGTNHVGPEVWSPFFASAPDWLAKGIAGPAIWSLILSHLNRLDAVVAPSVAAAEVLRSKGLRPPVTVISSGINSSDFAPTPGFDCDAARLRYGLDPEQPLFLFAGRLDGEKRLDVLIRALCRVQHREIQVAIAGTGMAEKALQKQARRCGLDGMVKFLGKLPHSEIPALLQASDVFLMPGDVESLSVATLEAMASGLPVIGANAMGVAELVQDGVNGYHFQAKDAGDLARQIDRIAGEPERWAEMGRHGRAIAARHDLSVTIAQFEQLYRSLIAEEEMLLADKP